MKTDHFGCLRHVEAAARTITIITWSCICVVMYLRGHVSATNVTGISNYAHWQQTQPVPHCLTAAITNEPGPN